MASGAKYVGDGAFVMGVPARDLTADEWGELPEFLRAMAVAAGLYRDVSEELPRRKVTGAGKKESEE